MHSGNAGMVTKDPASDRCARPLVSESGGRSRTLASGAVSRIEWTAPGLDARTMTPRRLT